RRPPRRARTAPPAHASCRCPRRRAEEPPLPAPGRLPLPPSGPEVPPRSSPPVGGFEPPAVPAEVAGPGRPAAQPDRPGVPAPRGAPPFAFVVGGQPVAGSRVRPGGPAPPPPPVARLGRRPLRAPQPGLGAGGRRLEASAPVGLGGEGGEEVRLEAPDRRAET